MGNSRRLRALADWRSLLARRAISATIHSRGRILQENLDRSFYCPRSSAGRVLFDVILIVVGAILIAVLLQPSFRTIHPPVQTAEKHCPRFVRLSFPLAVMLLAIVIILFVSAGVSVVFAGPPAVIVFIAIKKIAARVPL